MADFDPTLVHEWLARSAQRHPMKEAIVCGQERWSYGKLNACADRFGASLAGLGVRRQDRVAIMLGNVPETVAGLFGTLKAGGIFVLLESNTRARRLRYVLENCGAKVLVARRNQATVIAEALADLDLGLSVVWVGGEPDVDLPSAVPGTTWEAQLACAPQPLDASSGSSPRCIDLDLAAIIYTSATTGQAKGVMCPHRNMIAAAKSIIAYIGNRQEDIILNVLPLSFGYGLYQVLVSCMMGATVVLERSFLYPHVTMERIARERVTGFPLVPSMAARLLRMGNIDTYDFSSLRYVTSAGAALPVPHLQRLRRLVPNATLFNMYGLTECVRVCYLAGAELDQRPASVGRPMPNSEVRLVDDGGNVAGHNEVGELVVRGGNVMQGYWQDPEMTAQVFRSGTRPASRWLHTGDFFRMDASGYLYFLGRRDDMIKTRGERVSPREIEDVICELKEVEEAAVIGVTDEILGQAIKALVVCRSGALDEKRILRHCLNRLEPLLVPKTIEFVSVLPRTGRGKINRRQLQAVTGV